MFVRICFPLHSTFNMEARIENMDEFDERAFSMRKSGSIMLEEKWPEKNLSLTDIPAFLSSSPPHFSI